MPGLFCMFLFVHLLLFLDRSRRCLLLLLCKREPCNGENKEKRYDKSYCLLHNITSFHSLVLLRCKQSIQQPCQLWLSRNASPQIGQTTFPMIRLGNFGEKVKIKTYQRYSTLLICRKGGSFHSSRDSLRVLL